MDVDELRALADRHVAGPQDHGCVLFGFGPHPHSVHSRVLRDLADRLRIGCVVLLAFDEEPY